MIPSPSKLLLGCLILTGPLSLAARAQSYVLGNPSYVDLSQASAYVSSLAPGPTGQVVWDNHEAGVYHPITSVADAFTFSGNTTSDTVGSLDLTDRWNGDIAISGNTLTLTSPSPNNQIEIDDNHQMSIANNLVIDGNQDPVIGSETWSLENTLTLSGNITAATGTTQTIQISGEAPEFGITAVNITGSSTGAGPMDTSLAGTSSGVSFALDGVIIALGNAETFGNLSLLQDSTLDVSEISTSAPKKDEFNGGYTPGSSQLTVTGWQGQIGPRHGYGYNGGNASGTGGLNSMLLFNKNFLPSGSTVDTGIVYSVVFDLSTNVNGANSTTTYGGSGGGGLIPNFAGDPGILNTSYDYGEWITDPLDSNYWELVPYYGPVPEPTTIFAGLALIGALVWYERRRLSVWSARFIPALVQPDER